MGSSDKFCLRWNDFESNISLAFREIREEKDFFDCTLSVGDRQLQAHKLILSACSPFFRSILKKNSHPHPLLYLKGVEFSDLQSVLNFMYHGEVNVAQEELNSFLAVAEDLKVKGLTQNNPSGNGDCTDAVPKQTRSHVDKSPTPITVPRNVPNNPPAPPQNRLLPPHCINPQDNDDIQELMPVVKTEPVVEQQQRSVTTFQQSHSEDQVVGGTLTQTVYEDNDAYDYGGYEEGYEGMDEGTLLDDKGGYNINIDVSSFISEEGHCTRCGKTASKRSDLVKHIISMHIPTPSVSCQFCDKKYKNKNSLQSHISQNHRDQWIGLNQQF